MNQCVLQIIDEVNIKFIGLDPGTRRKLVSAVNYFIPYARHMPAYKLGRWDGKVSFATVAGASYINLLDKLLPIVIDAGYDIELDDRRVKHNFEFPVIEENHFEGKVWPAGHVHAGKPIVLRDYQVEVINAYLDNLQSIQEIATGAGKTLMTATLSSLVEPYGRSIVIVPSKSLVKQTEEDYRNLGLDVGVFYGDRKEYDKKHTIATWQSLSIFAKKSKTGDVDEHIKEWLTDVVCVIIDEVHSAKAEELKKLLTGPFANVPIRWGLTGTVPKEDFEFSALLAAIGPVQNKISAKELQDMDVLANLHVNVIQMLESKTFSNFHDEYDYLVTNDPRLKWMAEQLKEIAKTGNTLVLFTRLETGNTLLKYLPESVLINGSVKVDDRKEHYSDVNADNNRIILATSGVAAVGINIPRIFNLVMIEAGKSFVKTIQSIGRGIRKAQDKDFLNVWDICSYTKYSRAHLAKRKVYYKDAQYEYTIKKIDWLNGGKIQC